MKTQIIKLAVLDVAKQESGNHILVMYPGQHLPEEFNKFQPVIDKIFSLIPKVEGTSNEHFITIDSKFMSEDSALRREGLHIDGNFCVDPEFQGIQSWGGSQIETWGGSRIEAMEKGNYKIITPWKSEYNTQIPIGKYVSDDLGGIFCISDLAACEAYNIAKDIEVASQGDVEASRNLIESEGEKVSFEDNTLYFMSSNTPHESKIIKAGNRRTLIRVTLAHDYPNKYLKLAS